MNHLLQEVNIEDIKVGKRFRQKYEGIEELAASITEHGIIQPVTVNKNLELCAGGRRYMASVLAQKSTIPCIIRSDEEGELSLREIELVENLYREDMTWHERAELTSYIDKLKKESDPSWSGRKTAELLGKGKSAVAKDLQLAETLEKVPELKACKTEADAKKILENISRKVDAEEAIAKHKENPALQYADSHFRLGNAFEGMATQFEINPTSRVALIEIDPPYAIDLQAVKKSDLVKDQSVSNYNEIPANKYHDFVRKTCKLSFQCAGSNCWVIFWHAHQWQALIKQELEAAGFEVDPVPGIWLKGEGESEGRGQTNQPKTYLARAYEPFLIARKGSPNIQKQGRSNVFRYKPLPPAQKYHPTQRPTALMEELIQTFVTPNSIVMIPFLGSGATLLAAYNCHCTGYGWELNKDNKPLFLNSLLEQEGKVV